MESETIEVLRRAGRRAAIHLVKAGIEALKALEAFIEEIAHATDGPERDRPERIELD